jgi:hypothetical protein
MVTSSNLVLDRRLVLAGVLKTTEQILFLFIQFCPILSYDTRTFFSSFCEQIPEAILIASLGTETITGGLTLEFERYGILQLSAPALVT